jgi:hypothetical protein
MRIQHNYYVYNSDMCQYYVNRYINTFNVVHFRFWSKQKKTQLNKNLKHLKLNSDS